MAIEMTCACGKLLQLPDENAGALGQCPACGRVMPVREAAAPVPPLPPGEVSEAVTADPTWKPAPTSQADSAFSDRLLPAAPLDEWGEISRPPYKLFSPNSIVLVALFAGPVGPFLMMAINHAWRGKRYAAWMSAAGCLLFIVGVETLYVVIPHSDKADMPLLLLMLLGTWGIAWVTQSKPYDAHSRAGGETASGWLAAGLGVLGIIVFIGVGTGTRLALTCFSRL